MSRQGELDVKMMKTLKEDNNMRRSSITRRPVVMDAHDLNENTRSIKARAQAPKTAINKSHPKNQTQNQQEPTTTKQQGSRLFLFLNLLPGCLRLTLHDHLKTVLLLLLCCLTLPISLTLAVLLTSLPPHYLTYLLPASTTTPFAAQSHRNACQAEAGFRQRTVLVTGVGMTKGLTLARAFWLCGHRVVAADFDADRCGVWTPWKSGKGGWWWWWPSSTYMYSRAFHQVFYLRRPRVVVEDEDEEEVARARREYVDQICGIVEDQQIDFWVSCSGVASAVEDAMVMEALGRRRKETRQGKGGCACIQFDVPTTAKLHEKSTFIQYTRDELGLRVPETHDVVSQGDVLRALAKAKKTRPERRFILKPVGMDDVHRGNMTLLPLAQPWETEAYVRQLPIAKDRPWILQQFVRGGREYCTHALVVAGQVKVFTACPSSELLMHYRPLLPDTESTLTREMYDFTKTFAQAGATHAGLGSSSRGASFTGHLSFDFMADDDDDDGSDNGAASSGGKCQLYAIECNPRAHTAVALFADPGPEMRRMVKSYVSAIDINIDIDIDIDNHALPLPSNNGDSHHTSQQKHMQEEEEKEEAQQSAKPVAPPLGVVPRYWIGHDLVTLVLLPLLGLLRWQVGRGEVVESMRHFVDHVLYWKDGTFELWDPWPFVALYHHYWPKTILSAWWKGERWSRVNVSTTKMFAC